ncbi:MAG: hypothetical protein UT13_C0001G0451 [Candidatus Pacebacteria bacterium GW2011_GWF2_38_9]|nr:MAG: hypothetical protein US01_C0001G0463 [candidate division TM6 bacterium GW2011_GWF2_28_16]KKQ10236.1 MAG: hypothetical protein US20_C0002G0037 [Candidatus Pacebacteria bacterium GW2011_GWF1_36_5]KKQ88804.1 MAG: hypothetical protein UT13_C0001G0451 [Candidatus Pacebacteria bacterium GW2011_GWF2_38_9]HAZ73256.1 hypothetical protein [Candidatus Paceibacterota bacterium]
MLDEKFIILGALISFYGGLTYLIDTIKGKTKPNRVSWFLWTLAPMIAFAAEIDKGVGLTSLMTFMTGFNPLLIIIASFVNKKSYWKLNKMDYVYGSISLFAILIWQLTGEGNLAIFFAILADGFASIPTVVKSYRQPESESYKIFLFGMINAGITLLTIKSWTFAHWGFPVYIFLICVTIYSLVRFKLGVLIDAKIKQKLI